MNLKFINQSIRSTFYLSLIGFVLTLFFDFWFSIGLLSGGIWSSLNLIVLSQLIQIIFKIKKEINDYYKIFLILVLKFPALYAAGFLLLKITSISPWSLLLGFSIFLLGIFTVCLINLMKPNKVYNE